MKLSPGVGCLMALTIGSLTYTASGGSMVLREKINSVVVSDTLDGTGRPVAKEFSPASPQFLRTGTDSRAHVELGNAVFRLGAESAIRCDDGSADVQLLQGSALYANCEGTGLKVKVGVRTAIITGATGFAYLTTGDKNHPASLNVGSISGKTTVHTGSEEFTLNPADLMIVRADGKVSLTQFNLQKQIKTSLLVNGFETPLPNLTAIKREAGYYAGLEKRGFVRSLDQNREKPSLPDDDQASFWASRHLLQDEGRLGSPGSPNGAAPNNSVQSLAVTSSGSVASDNNNRSRSSSAALLHRLHNEINQGNVLPPIPGR